VWNLFGWRSAETGLRRFRQAQIEVARKFGKSTFAAYLACLLLLFDNPIEPGAQGYVAATKQEQATIVWEAAKLMIEQSPALYRLSKITSSKLKIEFPRVNSVFRPIASDSKKVDGFNPHFIIKDEEHAWREQHRGLADTLQSGFGSRRQPITLTITTYGDDRSHLWRENHDYAVRCLESVITGEIVDDTWFAYIAALDHRHEDEQPVPCYACKGENCPWCDGAGFLPIDDPYDESVWRKANPGIGDGPGCTPKLERMREAATLARQRPDKEPEFLQKNVQIITSSRSRVITPEVWSMSAGELSPLNGRTGYGGLDCGRTNDFAAIAAVWEFAEVDDDGKSFRRYEAITKTWTVQERPESLRTPFIQRWIDEGHLIESSGDQVDFTDVENSILKWHEAHIIKDWAYDKTFAHHLAQRLTALFGIEMFKFGQAAHFYTEPLRFLLSLLGKTRLVRGVAVPLLKHNGNPCVGWQATNLVVQRNAAGMMMPDKSNPELKIDAIVALLMALSECLYHQGGEQGWQFTPGSLAL